MATLAEGEMTAVHRLARRGQRRRRVVWVMALRRGGGAVGELLLEVGAAVEVVAGVVGEDNGGGAVALGKFEALADVVGVEDVHVGELLLDFGRVAPCEVVACVAHGFGGGADYVFFFAGGVGLAEGEDGDMMPEGGEVLFVLGDHAGDAVDDGFVAGGDEADVEGVVGHGGGVCRMRREMASEGLVKG